MTCLSVSGILHICLAGDCVLLQVGNAGIDRISAGIGAADVPNKPEPSSAHKSSEVPSLRVTFSPAANTEIANAHASNIAIAKININFFFINITPSRISLYTTIIT